MEKKCSEWTTGGLEHQDGAGRPGLWRRITGEGATRPHASHAPARGWRGCRRRHARDGAWDVGFRRGGHRRVDRPSALRNLWFSVGEELPGKSSAAVTAAAAVLRW